MAYNNGHFSDGIGKSAKIQDNASFTVRGANPGANYWDTLVRIAMKPRQPFLVVAADTGALTSNPMINYSFCQSEGWSSKKYVSMSDGGRTREIDIKGKMKFYFSRGDGSESQHVTMVITYIDSQFFNYKYYENCMGVPDW